MNKKLKTKCPKCKLSFEYYSSVARPFCSEKCKEIDLGFWLTESYSIEGKAKMVPDNNLKLDEDFDLGDNFSASLDSDESEYDLDLDNIKNNNNIEGKSEEE